MNQLIKSIFCILFSLVIASCSSTDKLDKEYSASSEDLKKYEGTDIAKTISETQLILDKAKEDKLGYYAPRHLKRAQTLLKQANKIIYSKKSSMLSFLKKKLTEEEKRAKFFSNIALSRRYVKNGYHIKKILEKELSNVFALKQSILTLNGDKVYSGEYEDLDERISEIIKLVEEKKEKYSFSKRADLTTDLKSLKAKLVIKFSLAETRKVLKKLKKKEYNLVAVKTYKKATETYKSSVNYIKTDTDNDPGVKKAAEDALFAANHAWFVSLEIMKMQRIVGGMNKYNYHRLEDIVLEQENQLKHIGEALKTKDFRDRPLIDQATEIAKVAEELVKKSKEYESRPRTPASAEKNEKTDEFAQAVPSELPESQ